MRTPSVNRPTVPAVLALGLAFVAPAEADDPEFERLWSATLVAHGKVMTDAWASDGLTHFFDQYEWTANESSAFPVDLGVRDAAFDLIDGRGNALVRLRFASPTSNLGVSGSQVGQAFLNQRAELITRLQGLDVDLHYRRFRTASLRVFPNTLGRPFQDLTAPDDVFTRDRTGFRGEIRLRPDERFGRPDGPLGELSPELSLRGDYQSRPGAMQRRFLLQPANDWIGFTQPEQHDQAGVGGGVLLVPGGRFTLDLDVDHQRFRAGPTVLQGFVSAVPPPVRTVGFVPDTDRLSGHVKLAGRVGRATIEAGFAASRLEQVGEPTPAQWQAGLRENELLHYAANAAVDVPLSRRWSARAVVDFDRRDNRIQRDTALFAADNGTQIDPFLRDWSRVHAVAEVAHEPWRRQIVALGARIESIDRSLDFADPLAGNLAILRENALVDADTLAWTVYARARLRTIRRMRLDGEIGYRGAPKTGYPTDLDRNVYGSLRASYTLPLVRPIVLSGLVRGGRGENRRFAMVDGIGPVPSGAPTPLAFERAYYVVGLTASFSPAEDWSLFGSFTHANDTQDYGLVLSNLQRYFQTGQVITFRRDSEPDWSNAQTSVILGAHTRIGDSSDAGAAYAFTRVDATYGAGVPTAPAATIAASSIVESNIHGLQLEAGHWLRDGLRVLVGYRLQLLDDASPTPAGQGSVIAPIPLSVTQHTITLGVTLTQDLLRDDD